MPTPKKITIGISATTPASPKNKLAGSIQSIIVVIVTTSTRMRLASDTSFSVCVLTTCKGMNETSSNGFQTTITIIHAAITVKVTIGNATPTHYANETFAKLSTLIATAFCGDAIGDNIPPMLHANAKPSNIPCGAVVS